jgi:hypothetical protein
MAIIIPPVPQDNKTSFIWTEWFKKLRTIVNDFIINIVLTFSTRGTYLTAATAAAQTQLYGRLARYQVEGKDNTHLAIGHVGSFVVMNGASDIQAYADTQISTDWGQPGTFLVVNPTALYGAALTDGRYWVYLKSPTGADPYDVVVVKEAGVSDRPDQNMMYRNSDQTQILLSTFYVYNALLLPYRQTGGRFIYSERTSTGFGGEVGNLALRNGNATVSTAKSFGSSVPLSPMSVLLAFQANRSGAGFRAVAGSEPVSLTTGAPNGVDIWGDGTTTDSATAPPLEMFNTNSQFYYAVNNAATLANAWIAGFQLW